MAKKTISDLVGRAVSDPAFRQDLLADPEGVARREGYALSPQEMATLKQMSTEGEGAFSRGLDERLSKSGFLLSPGDFLRDRGREVGLVPVEEAGAEGASGEELDAAEGAGGGLASKGGSIGGEEDSDLSGEELDAGDGPGA
jgi:hypothetical protein